MSIEKMIDHVTAFVRIVSKKFVDYDKNVEELWTQVEDLCKRMKKLEAKK